jgi:hypothetical protein
VTPGFLILIGYRGEYRPRKHDAEEITRIRERMALDESRREQHRKKMPMPLPKPNEVERRALEKLLEGEE